MNSSDYVLSVPRTHTARQACCATDVSIVTFVESKHRKQAAREREKKTFEKILI